MIWIDRESEDEAGDVIRPSGDWDELAEEKAIAAEAAIVSGESAEFPSSVYGHVDVRAALERLFHDKCAYCETKIVAGTSWDVEHYRPKGRVAERGEHPGYWWLAFVWTNLYPSCTFCNQRRRDRPRWGDPTTGMTSGKADRFPVLEESNRAMGPDEDLDDEIPMLLDPCWDDPEEYLAYAPDGSAVAIEDDVFATTSIEIYHLNRRRLRDARTECVQTVVKVLQVRDALRASGQGEAADQIEALLETEFLHDSQAYAGLSRYVVAHPEAFGIRATDA